MTDITDQDRLEARKWAESIADNPIRQKSHAWMNAVARVILSTVEPPARTLAEELRAWAENRLDDEPSYEELVDLHQDVEHFAARAEQIEDAKDEATKAHQAQKAETNRLAAEVDRLTEECAALTRKRDEPQREDDWLAGMKEAARYTVNAVSPTLPT